MDDKLRIFVCSDFHAFDSTLSGEEKPSWFNISQYGDIAFCPVTQLLDFFDRHKLQARVSICAGDLGDKAQPTSTRVAWQAFHRISEALESTCIVATAGNHDVDSRYNHTGFDAKGCLQSLDPKFPLPTLPEFDQYWSRHFAIITDGDLRAIILNSSAYHGIHDEYQHGRISQHTLAALKSAIKGSLPGLINILVCHHPPHSQSEKGQGEGDSMKMGEDLLDFLEKESGCEWLIIHGHKHYPALQYARGSGDSPVLLSCGALSANPYQSYGKDGKNQVHFIEFDRAVIKEFGLAGVVETYEWTSSTGWSPGRRDGGLPALCGFGNRVSSKQNAKEIAALVTGKSRWEDVVKGYPLINYLPGAALQRVLDDLEQSHNIVASFTRDGEPDELIRRQ